MHCILQSLDTARRTAGTWQILIFFLLPPPAVAKTPGRLFPLKQVLGEGPGIQKAMPPFWVLPAWKGLSTCPAWPGGTQGMDRAPSQGSSVRPSEADVTGSYGFSRRAERIEQVLLPPTPTPGLAGPSESIELDPGAN